MEEFGAQSSAEAERREIKWMENFFEPLRKKLRDLYWSPQKGDFEMPSDIASKIDAIKKGFYAALDSGSATRIKDSFEELEMLYKSEAGQKGRPILAREQY